jgi:hypothetical protein
MCAGFRYETDYFVTGVIGQGDERVPALRGVRVGAANTRQRRHD